MNDSLLSSDEERAFRDGHVFPPKPKKRAKRADSAKKVKAKKALKNEGITSDKPKEGYAVRRAGRGQGSTNYDTADVKTLLDAAEAILPTGGYEWEAVVDRYNKYAIKAGKQTRDANSLKRKFHSVRLSDCTLCVLLRPPACSMHRRKSLLVLEKCLRSIDELN